MTILTTTRPTGLIHVVWHPKNRLDDSVLEGTESMLTDFGIKPGYWI